MAPPTYGESEAVERNVSTLFPGGFTADTEPSDADVAEELTRQQAKIRQILHIVHGPDLPEEGTDAALIAAGTVESGTTAWALRVALSNRGAEGAEIIKRWERDYQDGLKALREMPEQTDDTPERANEVRYDDPAQRRDGRFTDEQLSGSQPTW